MKNEKKRQNRDFHVSRKHTSRWSWNLKIGMDNLYAYTTSQKKFQTQRPSGCRDIASRKTRNLEKRDISRLASLQGRPKAKSTMPQTNSKHVPNNHSDQQNQ